MSLLEKTGRKALRLSVGGNNQVCGPLSTDEAGVQLVAESNPRGAIVGAGSYGYRERSDRSASLRERDQLAVQRVSLIENEAEPVV